MSDQPAHCANCGTALLGASACPACGRAVVVNLLSPAEVAAIRARSPKAAIDSVLGVPLTSWWRRVGATLVDGIVLVIVSIFTGSLTHSLLGQSLITIGIGGAYQIILLSSARGQTVGNMAVGTAVRSQQSGQRLAPSAAVVRWFFVVVPNLVVLVAAHGQLQAVSDWLRTHSVNGKLPTTLPHWVSHDIHSIVLVGLVAFVYSMIDDLMPLGDARRRTIHDRLAGTVVIRVA